MSRCVIDKASIGELAANFLGPATILTAKVKLVSTKTGTSYGSANIQSWSKEVYAKLGELRVAMEDDLEKVFFDERHQKEAYVSSVNEEGLSEHLGADDVPGTDQI